MGSSNRPTLCLPLFLSLSLFHALRNLAFAMFALKVTAYVSFIIWTEGSLFLHALWFAAESVVTLANFYDHVLLP